MNPSTAITALNTVCPYTFPTHCTWLSSSLHYLSLLITLVFLIFTFRPFSSIHSFYCRTFSLSSSLLCATRTRSSAYNSSHGNPSSTGTTDVIFIARQLQERYRGRHRKLWWAFVDLEKAFDRVPRKVVEWAMRKLGVEEWLVRAVMAMYKHARTRVRSYGGSVSE